MREKNKAKGSAALCAILIMIMLIAVGTAVLVVTGRSDIDENANMPASIFSSSEEEEESSSEEETSSVEEEEDLTMAYPEKGYEFIKTNIESLSAKYTVLYDMTDGILYSAKNYTKETYPASLTKIMTVIVALENCDDLSQTYTFTEDDIASLQEENASVVGFSEGEEVTIEDMLYGAVLMSGADATLGLANAVAGSEEAFVELMNAKVTELGLKGTHFVNASGLHDDDHYSTCMDIALMIKYAINSEEIGEKFLDIISAETYTTSKTDENPSGITLTSIFSQRYAGYYIDRDADGEADADIIGGKTGFTDESGYSLASVYKIGDNYYVCVTIHSSSADQATIDNIAVAEAYLPVSDLVDSDIVEDEDEESRVIDTTPSAEDQTESTEDLTESDSSEDDSDEDSTSVSEDES